VQPVANQNGAAVLVYGWENIPLETIGRFCLGFPASRKLPKAEHSAPEWQADMEALILVATLDGLQTMFARIGCYESAEPRSRSSSTLSTKAALGPEQAEEGPTTKPGIETTPF
jgi:hypothetical protein